MVGIKFVRGCVVSMGGYVVDNVRGKRVCSLEDKGAKSQQFARGYVVSMGGYAVVM